MSSDKSILLVSGADDAYAMPLAVTLHSALKNLSDGWTSDVYVLDGGISGENRRRIERVAGRHAATATLHWSTIDMEAVSGLPTHQWINTSAYMRLFIPDIVPSTADKAIYIDSDTQVEESLSELWSHDVGGRALLAVQAYGTPYVSCRLGIDDYGKQGFDADDPYFNSGVLLINLDVWRREGIPAKSFEYVRERGDRAKMADQEALNAVSRRNWGQLDLGWNVMSHLVNFEGWPDSPFKEEVRPRREDLMSAPYIYHFAGGSKPWQIGCRHPAQLRWVRYLWESGWFSDTERVRWFGKWLSRYYWYQVKKAAGWT